MKKGKILLSKINENPDNPRILREGKLDKLIKSIKEFPKMLKIRPIVIDRSNEKFWIALAGNMRRKALEKLGYKEIPEEWVLFADNLTEEEKKRFIIADNVGFGDWDWEDLKENWDEKDLDDWGLEFPEEEEIEGIEDDETYTKKIEAPTYEPENEKPELTTLYDIGKTSELIEQIESSSLDKEVKRFLTMAAQRHTVFNYQKIADFYAHSDKQTQELMENSALVIIDFDRAIELGYVALSEATIKQYAKEYPSEE
jgi:hypothetical protein